MVTKSLTNTPFGKKLVYKVDGECVWSEYLTFSPPEDGPDTLSFMQRAGHVLGQIKRGVQDALWLKAS